MSELVLYVRGDKTVVSFSSGSVSEDEVADRLRECGVDATPRAGGGVLLTPKEWGLARRIPPPLRWRATHALLNARSTAPTAEHPGARGHHAPGCRWCPGKRGSKRGWTCAAGCRVPDLRDREAERALSEALDDE